MIELVEARARDGLRLHGARHLAEPEVDAAAALDVDGWLLLHGTASNFYQAELLGHVARWAARRGAPAVVANTRGHDPLSVALVDRLDAVGQPEGPPLRRVLGAAYEAVDECRHDVAGWLDRLAGDGCRRVALVGHSLGGLKALYAEAHEPHPIVAAVVAISPPWLSQAKFAAGPRADEFRGQLAEAERLVAAGEGRRLMEVRFPLPYLVSAAGYVEKYGPDEAYNLCRFIDAVGVPTLATFGSREVLANVAFQGLPEALAPWAAAAPRRQVAVVADADHQYTGVEGSLLQRIEAFLRNALRP